MDIPTLYIEYPLKIVQIFARITSTTHLIGEFVRLLYRITIPVPSCLRLERITTAAWSE